MGVDRGKIKGSVWEGGTALGACTRISPLVANPRRGWLFSLKRRSEGAHGPDANF